MRQRGVTYLYLLLCKDVPVFFSTPIQAQTAVAKTLAHKDDAV